jgi:hypothetical protein
MIFAAPMRMDALREILILAIHLLTNLCETPSPRWRPHFFQRLGALQGPVLSLRV